MTKTEQLSSAMETLLAIDKATCNAPLMSLEAQRHFERNPIAEEYRVQLCALILKVRELARAESAKIVETLE